MSNPNKLKPITSVIFGLGQCVVKLNLKYKIINVIKLHYMDWSVVY